MEGQGGGEEQQAAFIPGTDPAIIPLNPQEGLEEEAAIGKYLLFTIDLKIDR